jgi:predicted HD phosphohydrolase
MIDELSDLLASLDGVRQSARYHPEGDALFHSLQAFDLARAASADRGLWAAALLHDVGKALGSADHAASGADLLEGLVAPRIVWLVRHHLDLLDAPAATKRRLRGTRALGELQLLRAWDVGGRKPDAHVSTIDDALAILFQGGVDATLSPDGDAAPLDDHDDAEAIR